MNQYCVVVANGSKAQFFTLQDTEQPELEHGPNLVKLKVLHNDEMESHNQLWTEPKSGGNRGHGGKSHGYDDHRAKHENESEKKFANSIAETCKKLSHNHTTNLVLVSQKRMLGHLRSAMDAKLKGIEPIEYPKDLSKLSPLEIHQHLAAENLIPERRAPG